MAFSFGRRYSSGDHEFQRRPMSTALVQPYLFFAGRCDEALEFYRTAVGATVEFLMRYKENPDSMPPGTLPPGFEEKVMHVTFRIGGSTLMGSAGCDTTTRFGGFNLSLAFPTEAEAEQAFAALSQGGQVRMPMTQTFWSPRFGMVTDQFGLGWMVTVAR